jgi:hypothetical protein
MGFLDENDVDSGIQFSFRNETEAGEEGLPDSPERLLFHAVFIDGIQTFISTKDKTSAEAKRSHHEALTWIQGGETEYLFSFENVCESLGLNAQYIRHLLLNRA